MTNKVQQEETPNPYNQKKSWHTEDKPFVSANDGLYFEEPTERNKLFNTDDITEVDAEGSVNKENLETTKDTPYKKPDYKKRYDDLKKHYDRKLNEFKARETELQSQVKQPEYVTPKTEEELQKFKQDYPDVYEVVETVAHLQSDAKAKVLEERLSKLQEREMQISRQEAEKRLMERHPDFDEIRDSDDFHKWANNQPESIKSWIYSNADDADLASRALDLFKRDMGISLPQEDKSSSTTESAADMVSTKTTTVEPKQEKVWSEKEIAAMSVAEFDKYEEEISNAMQEGRIVK